MPYCFLTLSLMKVFLAAMVLVGGVACTSLGNLDELRSANRQNVVRLNIGMTKQEVLNLMGTESETDHYANYEQLTVTNPYKSESYEVDGNVLEVLYYYTDKKHETKVDYWGWSQATQITEDELTPVLLENGKVIGWGERALGNASEKYEIRLR